mmetsp:Transcript_105651/g.340532  ORF Transcript_105651/g.340532 Transcript_105651/m.340532 type:complete len:108 (+) Transcript_105651:160-483(+)
MAAPEVDLGCCGFQGHCCSTAAPSSAAGSAAPPPQTRPQKAAGEEDPEESVELCPGLRLAGRGFSRITSSPSSATSGGAARWEALAPSPVVLAPGEAVEGQISLELV